MKKFVNLFVFFCLLILPSAGQNNNPCSQPEGKQFDFWIGNWNLTWTQNDGQIYKGENEIKYIFDGCVVREHFLSLADGFEGISHSVYVPKEQVWKQTWVSNGGGYLDFVGGWENDKMILSRKFVNKNNQEIHQRMVWYNIKENSLDWNWEKSTDGGETWKTLWHINYKRK